MADRDDWGGGEPLGYKRPPWWGRFQKGQSGNPKGRPRKKKAEKPTTPKAERESDAVLRKLLSKRHRAIEDGQSIELTTLEVLRRRQIKKGVDGDPHALREINRDVERMEARKEERERLQAELEAVAAQEKAQEEERLFRYLKSLKQKQSRQWKSAMAQGLEEPDEPWPHPDDIILSQDGKRYILRGPLSAEDLSSWESLRPIRDYYVAEMALGICNNAPALVWKLWLGAALLSDRKLPLRWQVCHDLNKATDPLVMMRLPRLMALVEQERSWLSKTFVSTRPRTKEEYRNENLLFGPALRLLGYRSLKQFERACEDTDGNPPLRIQHQK